MGGPALQPVAGHLEGTLARNPTREFSPKKSRPRGAKFLPGGNIHGPPGEGFPPGMKALGNPFAGSKEYIAPPLLYSLTNGFLAGFPKNTGDF